MTETLHLLNGKTIRVPNGWQHSPYQTNYRISENQAKTHNLSVDDIPTTSGIRLYVVRDPSAQKCPHCQDDPADVLQVIAR